MLGNGRSRIVVVSPHPDDEVLGVGGTMARHVDAGDEVHVLVVTRGNPAVFSDESVERVRAEARAAHELLGVSSTVFGEFPAPGLDTVPHYELVDFIAAFLREVGAETVYGPHPGDSHLDHLHVFRALLAAARPRQGMTVGRILSYETLSETEWGPPHPSEAFVPNVFVDVSETLPRKLAAMECYESQLMPPPDPRSLRAIRGLAQMRGSTVASEAAEAFALVREVLK